MKDLEIPMQFQTLVDTFAKLRGPEGCPWDKKQTHQTLKPYLLEEAYELLEAIDRADDESMKSELGDVLLQVMLHSQISKERKSFDIYDVINTLNEKMLRRHPHVFAGLKVTSSEQVMANWEMIKQQEGFTELNPFKDIPLTLPALQRSAKIGQKSIRYNFDWSNVEEVLSKVDEELAELREAIALNKEKREVELELGDILFTLAQVGRRLEIDPEQALRATNKKFEVRFLKMRQLCLEDGLDFSQLSTQQLELYWVRAKNILNKENT